MAGKRRKGMAAIRSQDTKPEILLRKALWRKGARYRLHYRAASVRIDIAFPGSRVAVFVDGCFWHGCPEHYRKPPGDKPYWVAKLERNRSRDARNSQALQEEGWTVLRFWEHEVLSDVTLVRQVVLDALQGRAGPSGETSDSVLLSGSPAPSQLRGG